MTVLKAAITAVASYVPEYVLTNAELEKMVDTNDQWITERTGIKERRILKEEGKGASYLGGKAVKALLEKTNTSPEEIDLLICATATADFVFPATANLIANEVGIKKGFHFDVMAACSGFIYALHTASQFIETGKYKKIVVVGADKMSSIVDYTDRSTCIIFGDGAGAVLLEPTTEESGIIDAWMRSDGAGWTHLHQKAGGSRKPASIESVQNKEHFIYQEGAVVFKHAVQGMAEACMNVMKNNNIETKDIDWLVPHQANKRIIDSTYQKMGLPVEKVMINIHKYGNTTNATIPLCLSEYEQQLKKGDKLILAAFGGGFTWGAIYVKWAYDTLQ
ncbi:MAG: beta-ketoacyl-ACP synthase III [Thermonemataceae bacterium]|nr:beta-ketoacyl-ACP synthase III [Thermonemataceae bacterium]